MKKAEIRVDEALLKQVEPILKEMGLTVEMAVELYFKEVIRSWKIHFPLDENRPRTFKELIAGFEGEYQSEEWDTGKPVGNEHIYNNPEYVERLLESIKQIEVGKAKEIDALDFIESLLKEEIKESDLRAAHIKSKKKK